jgi:hypothetical protein
MVYHKKTQNIKRQISKTTGIIYFFLLICLIYYLFKLVTSSVFLMDRDKINVVFYGETTRFFSLDKKNTNYLLPFSNLVKVVVPGGYGKYKVGAIGKLASLERKPDIIGKTFSATTATMVDLYFYQKKTIIYYENKNFKQTPSLREIFLTNSNANLIDRLFIFYIFSTNNKESFQEIDLSPYESGGTENLFDHNAFYKRFQGSFFQRSFREDDVNVQIIYKDSYKTAQLIGQMIEGEGIRVVDLSNQGKASNNCILTAGEKISETKAYKRLANFFSCKTQIGETTVSDIILELGSLEKGWAVD